MALTVEDFDRINTFLNARHEPLLALAREQGNTDLVTALTALSRAVESSYAVGRDLLLEEALGADRETVVAVRWDHLGTMAYEWRNHPDYRPEFEMDAGQLGGIPPLPPLPAHA